MIVLTNDLIITFGKYWGKTYGQINILDKSYGFWLKSNWSDLSKNIKIPKPKVEEKEEVYEIPKTLNGKLLCHFCCQYVSRRSKQYKCEICTKWLKDYIPRIVILRHQKEIKKGKLIF
jgi:hypothetical protein